MLKTIASIALLAAAGAAQAGIPANINFDGYCDGLTGLTKNGYAVSGTWRDVDCGGTGVAIGGTQGKAKGMLSRGYIMSSDIWAVYGLTIVTVINADGTWVYYDAYGNTLNSGTWSAAAEGAKPTGTKPSLQK